MYICYIKTFSSKYPKRFCLTPIPKVHLFPIIIDYSRRMCLIDAKVKIKSRIIAEIQQIQPGQSYMAVLFCFLVKGDASVHWTSPVLQCTRTTRPYITGHPVVIINNRPWFDKSSQFKLRSRNSLRLLDKVANFYN